MTVNVALPLSICTDTFGTGQVSEENITKAVSQYIELTPRGIHRHLVLKQLIYQCTAACGDFRHSPDADGLFSFSRTDLVDARKADLFLK